MDERYESQLGTVLTIATVNGEHSHAHTQFFTVEQWELLMSSTVGELVIWQNEWEVPPDWFPRSRPALAQSPPAKSGPERRLITLLVEIDHEKTDPPHDYEGEDGNWGFAVGVELESAQPAIRVVDSWDKSAEGATDASSGRRAAWNASLPRGKRAEVINRRPDVKERGN
jgi:hypothetical protein